MKIRIAAHKFSLLVLNLSDCWFIQRKNRNYLFITNYHLIISSNGIAHLIARNSLQSFLVGLVQMMANERRFTMGIFHSGILFLFVGWLKSCLLSEVNMNSITSKESIKKKQSIALFRTITVIGLYFAG
jgi:hypothetical protein